MTDSGSPANQNAPSAGGSGFFAALFDLDFKEFVALKFIKVIYVIAIVFVGLAGVGLFLVSVASNEYLTAILALVFLLFYLIAIRVWLEVIAVLFRIGDNTSAIRAKLEQS
ncbi:MAG: DUF4282 domain-containing protein [Acidimicrobiia bacterium]